MDWIALGAVMAAFAAAWLGYQLGQWRRDRCWRQRLPGVERDAIDRSRRVLGGKFSEQLAPYLPDFPYDPTEARFLGSPVDLVVFRGSATGNPAEVVFVEVKTGRARQSRLQRRLAECVAKGRVRWEVYRVPSPVTE